MNIIASHYKHKYSTLKGYYLLEMQISSVSALLISILASFTDPLVMLAEIAPAIVMAVSLRDFRREYRKEFPLYAFIFNLLFAVGLAGPILIRSFLKMNDLASVQYVFYAVIACLVIFMVARVALSKKKITGKVLFSDKNEAVVFVDFDIFTGIRGGKYVVKNKGAVKGQNVELSVSGGLIAQPRPDRVARILR
ncbi:MAG: DUF2101 family protein [Candidatus Micrarchaeota archaeon]